MFRKHNVSNALVIIHTKIDLLNSGHRNVLGVAFESILAFQLRCTAPHTEEPRRTHSTVIVVLKIAQD